MENTAGARERMEAIIRLSGLKQYEFAQRIGVSKGAISHITSSTGRKAAISADMARLIVDRLPELNLSYDWVLSGMGTMTRGAAKTQPSLFDRRREPIVQEQLAAPETAERQAHTEDAQGQSAHRFADVGESYAEKDVFPTGLGVAEPFAHIHESPVDPSAKLERIVMFYSDGTFVDYRPRNG